MNYFNIVESVIQVSVLFGVYAVVFQLKDMLNMFRSYYSTTVQNQEKTMDLLNSLFETELSIFDFQKRIFEETNTDEQSEENYEEEIQESDMEVEGSDMQVDSDIEDNESDNNSDMEVEEE